MGKFTIVLAVASVLLTACGPGQKIKDYDSSVWPDTAEMSFELDDIPNRKTNITISMYERESCEAPREITTLFRHKAGCRTSLLFGKQCLDEPLPEPILVPAKRRIHITATVGSKPYVCTGDVKGYEFQANRKFNLVLYPTSKQQEINCLIHIFDENKRAVAPWRSNLPKCK